MKKRQSLLSIIIISLILSPLYGYKVDAHTQPQMTNRHKHIHISDQEFNELIKKGYTRHEIMKAHFISKHSKEKNLEEILIAYKKNQSWKETANSFGVDLEKIKQEHVKKQQKFYNQNKTKIIQYLAAYTGKSPAELEKYLKEDIDLHFLIVSAAISKVSNKDLDQIIQYKKDGKNFKEMMTMLKLDEKTVFEEAKKLHHGIHRVIEK